MGEKANSFASLDVSKLTPEVKQFVVAVDKHKRTDADFSQTEYGHAVMALAVSNIGYASIESDPEKQNQYLRQTALATIKQYGPKIIPLLKDELRLALTDENLASIEN